MSCRVDIHRRVQQNGFKTLEHFVCHFVMNGYGMVDLAYHIQRHLKIYYHYQTYYYALLDEYREARTKRKALEKMQQSKLRRRMREAGFCQKNNYWWWHGVAQQAGFNSFKKAINEMHRKGYSRKDMAKTLNCSYKAFLLRYKKMYSGKENHSGA